MTLVASFPRFDDMLRLANYAHIVELINNNSLFVTLVASHFKKRMRGIFSNNQIAGRSFFDKVRIRLVCALHWLVFRVQELIFINFPRAPSVNGAYGIESQGCE